MFNPNDMGGSPLNDTFISNMGESPMGYMLQLALQALAAKNNPMGQGSQGIQPQRPNRPAPTQRRTRRQTANQPMPNPQQMNQRGMGVPNPYQAAFNAMNGGGQNPGQQKPRRWM